MGSGRCVILYQFTLSITSSPRSSIGLWFGNLTSPLILPNLPFSPKSYFLVLPRFAFILGRTSLIFTKSVALYKLFSPLDAWVSLAFCKNFGSAEVTGISEMKRKTSFPFAFHSIFRNFGRICRYKGSSGDWGFWWLRIRDRTNLLVLL